MSYCRFSNKSDVYLYPNFEGFIVCCSCRLAGRNRKHGMYNDKSFKTSRGALNHLAKHRAAGHKVEKYAEKRLEQELYE